VIKAASINDPDNGPSASLVEVDGELAHAIPEPEREQAAQVRLPIREIWPGDPLELQGGDLGLLVVSGLAWSEVRVGPGCTPQLLTAGALILNATPVSDFVEANVRIAALSPVCVAGIRMDFMRTLARWPSMAVVLASRLGEQQHDLAVQAALGQLPRVEDRILAFLWRLAERCGTVGTEGVRVPLQLTHERLGLCVGSQRSTVSLALTTMRDRGLLDRDGDGAWLLFGAPPDFSDRGGAPVDGLPQWLRRDGNGS
jgi:CRP/FNR family transcriptional regulator, cyclic AMP receptor protein